MTQAEGRKKAKQHGKLFDLYIQRILVGENATAETLPQLIEVAWRGLVDLFVFLKE